ncbi:MAG: hypothetical protein KF809_08740 [Chloroflexi bacterium]|nr:hypothetical protein [Chloroflexota bacterium]
MVDDHSRPAPLRDDRPRAATLRSGVMLEVAAALVARPDWGSRQVRIDLRPQGGEDWPLRLFASDSVHAIHEVARGDVAFAIVNPAVMAALAVRGSPPFPRSIPLRAIATIPSYDQLGLGVAASLGVGDLTGLASARPALRLSLRGQRDHSVHLMIEHVLGAVGLDLDDLVAAGGHIGYDEGLPHHALRSDAMAAGTIDALFDEGIYNWVDLAVGARWRFLAIDEAPMARLEAMGYRRATLTRARFPALTEDVPTLDFSGFLIYTHADVDDRLVEAVCRALHERRDRIAWQGHGGLPLERMVAGAVDAPLPIPFHDAALRYWRSVGMPVTVAS